MSVPKNHHYLSQVLLKKFLDSEGRLNYYSKSEKRIINKEYSRFDFAESFLNSIITNEGEIDHKTVEDNLNHHFESGFNKHYESLFRALKQNDHSLITSSISYLIRMGIIGDMRTPQNQIETHEVIFGALRQISLLGDKDLQHEFEDFLLSVSHVKNKLPVDYKNLTEGIEELMGECIYSLFIANQNDFFFLPDNTSVVIRSKLEPDIVFNGEILESMSMPIATIIYPIDSHNVIVAQSTKICPQENHGIYNLSSKVVSTYNRMFLDSSRDKVICESPDYLKEFISNVS
jgi:hypothetical protein